MQEKTKIKIKRIKKVKHTSNLKKTTYDAAQYGFKVQI